MKEKLELKRIFHTEYSDNKLVDFRIKTGKVFDVFNIEFKLGRKEVTEQIPIGGRCFLNNKFKDVILEDVTILRFENPYPVLLSKVANTNLEHFNEVYSRLLEIYKEDKYDSLKRYINMTFGCIGSEKCAIYSPNIYNIPQELAHILDSINNEFPDNVVYIDTDIIFFINYDTVKENVESLLESINTYNLSYSYERSKFLLCTKPKKYIYENNGNLKIIGMKNIKDSFSKRGGQINLH